jgi:hypothetical protein
VGNVPRASNKALQASPRHTLRVPGCPRSQPSLGAPECGREKPRMLLVLMAVAALVAVIAATLHSGAKGNTHFRPGMEWALALPTVSVLALILVARYGPFTRGSPWVAYMFLATFAIALLSLVVSIVALALLIKQPLLRSKRSFVLTLISLSVPLSFTLIFFYLSIIPYHEEPGRCPGANCDNASSNQRLERP